MFNDNINETEKTLRMLVNKEICFILSYGAGRNIMNVIPNGVYKFSEFKKRKFDNKMCVVFKNDEEDKQISIPINKVLSIFSEKNIIVNYISLGLSDKYYSIQDVVNHLSDLAMKDYDKKSSLKDLNNNYAIMKSLDNLNAHYEQIGKDEENLGNNFSIVPVLLGKKMIKSKTYDIGNFSDENKMLKYFDNDIERKNTNQNREKENIIKLNR